MPTSEPRILKAQQREAGVACAECSAEIVEGESVAVCVDCGAVHHEPCWDRTSGCVAYECVGVSVDHERLRNVSIRVHQHDLRAAVPLERSTPTFGGVDALKRRWNRVSVWAFAVSLLGVPLFGIVTGVVAMVLACVALVGHRANQRGIVLAALAMVIGLADIIGWSVGLSYYLGGGGGARVAFSEMTIDTETLNELPDKIARAMRANVLIDAQMGFGKAGIGSGVVLKVADGVSYIVTNRHVVDGDYTSGTMETPTDLSELARLTVGSIGAVRAPAAVEWVAPNGIDLALISARFPEGVIQEAFWDIDQEAVVGDPVFAIGNPHGLGWTHTSGSVSQLRRQSRGGFSFRLLQTSAAINSGNSGGGLYDAVGRLIGINTMTAEKRFAEGLGFSIAYGTLIDLLPEKFGIGQRNPDPPTDSQPAVP